MNIFMVAQLRQTDIKNSGWLWSRDLELAITLLYFSIGQLRYYRICVSHRLRTNPNSLGTQVYNCFYRKQLVAAKLLLPDHHANELAFHAADELAFNAANELAFMLQTSQLFMLQTSQLFMLQTSQLFICYNKKIHERPHFPLAKIFPIFNVQSISGRVVQLQDHGIMESNKLTISK